jgi:hypothetical protein
MICPNEGGKHRFKVFGFSIKLMFNYVNSFIPTDMLAALRSRESGLSGAIPTLGPVLVAQNTIGSGKPTSASSYT